MQRRTVIAAAAAGLVLAALPVYSQQAAWPSRPVRWIVPWAAGGAADVIARTIAQKLSERWGQPVVVENKPGASTIIAATEVIRAPADGYTLFMPLSATMSTNPYLYSKLPYDPLRDFTLIGLIVGLPLIVLGSDVAPGKTLLEVIDAAKKNPDTVTVGSATGSQLQVEQWMRDWGVKLRYIPYKSGADVTKALLGNEIQIAVDAIPANLAHIRAGKMKGLALNTAKRMPMLPEVPTLDDLKLKNTAPAIWHGLVAPAGLPAALQSRIYADVQAVLALPDVREKLVDNLGTEIVPGIGAQELTQKVRAEMTVVEPLVKELGLKVE